jgi:hypothetical protein
MNIIYHLNDYKKDNIFLLDTKKNMLMEGKFTKVLYSNILSTIGIYFSINVSGYYINNSLFKIDKINDLDILYKIEQDMLEFYKARFNVSKSFNYTLRDTLKSNMMKLYKTSEYGDNIILKISGIWENETHVGITFKFSKVN